MRRAPLIILSAISGLMLACSGGDADGTFEQQAEWAAQSFPAPVVTQEELRANVDDFVLVDTRSREEFAVSHLPGAINWDNYRKGEVPDVVRRQAAEGNSVVFYCSIGYRSGEATVLAGNALGSDARLFNLRGGIFQWANEGGDLQGGKRVHGYNDEWKRLLLPEKLAP